MGDRPEQHKLTRCKIFPAKIQFVVSTLIELRLCPWNEFHHLDLGLQNDQYRVTSKPNIGTERDLGILDIVTKGHLDSLSGIATAGLSMKVVVPAATVERLKGKGKKTVVVDASVNLFGPEPLADQVGDALERTSAHLQHPFCLPLGIRYINPQWFYPDNIPTDLRHLVGPPITESELQRVSDVVELTLGSLDSPAHVSPGLLESGLASNPCTASQHLRTALKPYVNSPAHCD